MNRDISMWIFVLMPTCSIFLFFATIRGLRSVAWKVKVSNRRLGLNTRIDKGFVFVLSTLVI
mgnify:CR=1 FL=1